MWHLKENTINKPLEVSGLQHRNCNTETATQLWSLAASQIASGKETEAATVASQHSQWEPAEDFADCSCNHNYFGCWWHPPLEGKWSRRIWRRLLTLAAPTSQVCFFPAPALLSAGSSSIQLSWVPVISDTLIDELQWMVPQETLQSMAAIPPNKASSGNKCSALPMPAL